MPIQRINARLKVNQEKERIGKAFTYHFWSKKKAQNWFSSHVPMPHSYLSSQGTPLCYLPLVFLLSLILFLSCFFRERVLKVHIIYYVELNKGTTKYLNLGANIVEHGDLCFGLYCVIHFLIILLIGIKYQTHGALFTCLQKESLHQQENTQIDWIPC